MPSHTQTPNEPLTLLMSAQAAADFGPRIALILNGRSHRFIGLDAIADANAEHATDIAFLSRDVTGSSGKTQLSETLQCFYRLLRGSPRLQWLQIHSAGADRPIYGELRGRNITITTASGANAEPVAQMAVTGVLALARRLPVLMDAQRRRSWEPLLGARAPSDLRGQSALIVGMGPIGQEVARLLKALRMRVIGMRRTPALCENLDEVVAYDALERVLPQTDWLILACPLTDTTRRLIDERRLALLPRGAHLVNVSRGEVVVEADVTAALGSGQLGGAFLDVFEKEPLSPDSALWAMPNVIISPHTAGHTTGHYAAVAEIFLDNLARWRDCTALRNKLP